MINAISPPTEAPTMSCSGFALAEELAAVGAERLIVVGVGVGEAEVEAVPLGKWLERPAEGAVVAVPLGNSLEGEVEVGV